MPINHQSTIVVSLALIFFIYSGMHIFSGWLTSSQLHIIFGGFIGSILFMLLLTAFGNFEMAFLERNFQTKVFPEVILCMIVTMIMMATIHRVCATTSFLFSLVALYYMNQISQRRWAPQAPPQPQSQRKKKTIFT